MAARLHALALALALLLAPAAAPAQAAPLAFDGCPAMIVEAFGAYAEDACYVAFRESGFRVGATGTRGEKGWFQIHPIHGPGMSSYDPETNVRAALSLSNGGRSFCPVWAWTC